MDRIELERLDRDTLIARAEENGVTRARILTRPELIDELLVRTTRSDELPRVRGLFGRARDLLARVIERGLHLPDAAERLRQRTSYAAPVMRGGGQPLPTVTLAEIYAAQGHRDRAIATVRTLLDDEPDHVPARALLRRLEDAGYQGPKPRALGPEDEEVVKEPDAEPIVEAAVEEEQLPAESAIPSTVPFDGVLPSELRSGDECVVLPIDGDSMFVTWRVRQVSSEGERGAITLRMLIVAPTWDGPQSYLRDVAVGDLEGKTFLRELPAGAIVRAAVGWQRGEQFIPLAVSPALERVPGDAPTLLRWTPEGTTPLTREDADAAAIARALASVVEVGPQATISAG